jgi:hypothetical protein
MNLYDDDDDNDDVYLDRITQLNLKQFCIYDLRILLHIYLYVYPDICIHVKIYIK